MEDFMVKDLQEDRKLKSFIAAAGFKYKNTFYYPSFWTSGINYKRFDFNGHFIVDTESRPISFLREVGSHGATDNPNEAEILTRRCLS